MCASETLGSFFLFYFQIILVCKGEVKFKNVPFLRIDISDHITEELIAKIPGYISAQSYFPE